MRPPQPKPSDFTGYPEIVTSFEYLRGLDKAFNTSCPGETTGSFLYAGVPDYGCNSSGPQGQPPFKTWIGLHTNYPGTQIDYAMSRLAADKTIKLVTLSIGANDVLLLLQKCQNDPACINAGMPGTLTSVGTNLAIILGTLRSQYQGTLVISNYAAPTPDLDPIAKALNGVIAQVGAGFGARLADAYTAFYNASAWAGHDACKAGLVGKVNGECDIHPTLYGQFLYAAEVERAIWTR
jgi:lysophospholipase L1-like esterase